MDDFVVMSTVGQHERFDNEEEDQRSTESDKRSVIARRQFFIPVLEALISEMKRRFIDTETIPLSAAVSNLLALEPNGIEVLIDMYKDCLKLNSELIKSEIAIAKTQKIANAHQTTNDDLADTALNIDGFNYFNQYIV